MDDAMAVCLLGPIEVHAAAGSAPVAGTKLQSVLAMLALAAPHPVSDDHLLEGLWGDDQPRSPANALQALVSTLRRQLGRDAVERRGTGYVLSLDPDSIDAVRLERLVREGRDAAAEGDDRTAVDRFRAAVSLCRGPPLGDLADSWFAREAAARLTELALAAQEGLAESELAMGRHADLVVPLTDLVAEHPLRERLRALLMIALYRSGRQTDALQVYRDTRSYLLDELGLDPGPELRALERSILAHDPALASPVTLVPTTTRPALPQPLTSFVGRVDELAELDAAIESSRLTTVLGPGGVGKTRLVLELGRRLADRHDLAFAELAPVAEPGAVDEAIATALGAYEREAGGPLVAALDRCVDRIGSRPAVVILDNCEHVASAAANAAHTLLSRCPHARVVATSREPLRIEGEQHVAVGPLDPVASSQLFLDRARAVQPHFGTAADGELDALCSHLDGLPLAIELAAARAKTLPLPEISARLQDRFQLLRRVQRTGTSRHEGLRAAIDWSYGLLFEEDQRVFRWLAVFAGGATIAAAEAVCGPEAFDTASRLVDRSLLLADTSGDEVRFGMLESLRDYGLARLVEAGELDDARRAHVAWCTALAERVDVEARGAQQLTWLARLDREHDNIRAALGYALEHDLTAALWLVGAVILPWWFRGRRQETRQWTAACLAAPGAELGDDENQRARARVLAYSGLVAEPREVRVAGGELRAELAIAEERQREALSIFQGDEVATAYGQLLLLATVIRRASAGEAVDPDEFAALASASAGSFDRLGDDYGSCVTRVTDALFALVRGDAARAATVVAQAAAHAVRSGDRFSASRVEYVLGMIDDLRGDPSAAYQRIERGLRLLDELGTHQAVTAQARLLAGLAERNGEPQLAAQWRAFVNDRGDTWTFYDGAVMAAAHNHDGLTARVAGDLERAEGLHARALDWYGSAALPAGIAFSASCLGFLAAQRGDSSAAASHHHRALDAAMTSGDPASVALALEGVAGVLDRPDEAARVLGAAWRLRPPGARAAHREDVDAIVLALRTTLGEEGLASALDEGHQAALADITALAVAAASAG